MSYYDTILKYKGLEFDKACVDIRKEDVQRAIEADNLGARDLISLLSPAAESLLEEMAEKARAITLRYFGKVIQLYTPMYLSNYCDNQCIYCGFNSNNNIDRKKLSLDEVEKEAQFISASGLKHILILTGESRKESPPDYIVDCIRVIKKYFSSIYIEVYPLSTDEYAGLISEGVDGLTVYQEVYDQDLYAKMHPAGPKKDYYFRLEAPERAAYGGMRNINIGALLGLAGWRKEVFLTGLHAKYLQDKFSDVEIGVSVPRIRPQVSSFKAPDEVSDRNIVQIILALRIFLHRIGITLSTRESAVLRDRLILLGVTRISAGSTTSVGGHTQTEGSSQFRIHDERGVEAIKAMLERKGYQPVLKDWMKF